MWKLLQQPRTTWLKAKAAVIKEGDQLDSSLYIFVGPGHHLVAWESAERGAEDTGHVFSQSNWGGWMAVPFPKRAYRKSWLGLLAKRTQTCTAPPGSRLEATTLIEIQLYSSLPLATFQGLNRHMLLVTTVPDSIDLQHFHDDRKFYWTTLI